MLRVVSAPSALRLVPPSSIARGSSSVLVGGTVYRALALLLRRRGRAPVRVVCRAVWGGDRCMNTVYSLCDRANKSLEALGSPVRCGVDEGAVVLL